MHAPLPPCVRKVHLCARAAPTTREGMCERTSLSPFRCGWSSLFVCPMLCDNTIYPSHVVHSHWQFHASPCCAQGIQRHGDTLTASGCLWQGEAPTLASSQCLHQADGARAWYMDSMHIQPFPRSLLRAGQGSRHRMVRPWRCDCDTHGGHPPPLSKPSLFPPERSRRSFFMPTTEVNAPLVHYLRGTSAVDEQRRAQRPAEEIVWDAGTAPHSLCQNLCRF